MKIKEKIQADFVTAMKMKDADSKSALSGIKAKITEAEKAKGNAELSDDEVIKVLSTAIKQRKQSYDEFVKGGREDLARKEDAEMKILQNYMPAQMSDSEIEEAVKAILSGLAQVDNPQKKTGQAIGAFNKQYAGRADMGKVKSVIEKLANEI